MNGVEENAQSRFIDYTFATPWESLCSDVEHGLKRWFVGGECNAGFEKLTITYLDSKHAFLKLDVNYSDEENLYNSLVSKLLNLFGVASCVVFVYDCSRTEMTISQRQTLFSALCCGLQSSSCHNVPVFIVSSEYLKSDLPFSEIRGYELKQMTIGDNRPVTAAVMYETAVFEGIDCKHDLYYLDGIVRLFDLKLSAMSVGTMTLNNASCSMTESFHYNHDGSSLSQRQLLPLLSLSAYQSNGYEFSYVSYLSSLWSIFPDYNPTRAITAELEIRIAYSNLKQGSFIDNERYTTCQPSKQKPSSWFVRAAFKPLTSVAVKRVMVEGQLHASASMLSSATRRLLSFFMYSFLCGAPDASMNNLLRINKSSEHRIKSADRVLRLASSANLSPKTKLVLEEMCSKIPRSSRAPDKASYLSLLFSHHNRWPAAQSAAGSAQTGLGSLVELMSMAIGSLSLDMQSVAEIWSDCLSEMRRHWENDLPIPASWSSSNLSQYSEADIDQMEACGGCSSSCSKGATPEEHGSPIWNRHLWSDSIHRKLEQDTFVCLPDMSASSVVQKIQLLNFCIVFKREDLNLKFSSDLAPREYQDLSIDLQRRVPLTSEAAAQRDHMADKFTANLSKSATENPMLRWQTTHPALVSDMRAYKAALPFNQFVHFLSWYTGIAADEHEAAPVEDAVDVAAWNELWDICEACPAHEQRPIFRVETEAEKCLAYLEAISLRSLAVQLLMSSLSSVYLMLRNELRPWRSGTHEPQDERSRRLSSVDSDDVYDEDVDVDSDTSKFINSELELLRRKIIELESVSTSTDFTSIESLTDFIVQVDKTADMIEGLEEFIVQSHEIGTVLMLPPCGPGSRLVSSLCRGKECVAQNETDVSSLFELVKFVSRGSESHLWTSEDGRELGKPTKKSFSVRCSSASRLVDSFTSNDSGCPTLDHSLVAEVEGSALIVATMFSEQDS